MKSSSAEGDGISTDPRVDAYIARAERWRPEIERLRAVLLATPLVEELKWRQPCYTLAGKNVAIVSAFADHAVLGFFKGALLDDPDGLLVQPGPHTQSSRHLPFTSVDQIEAQAPAIRAFLRAAVANERAGRTVRFKNTAEYDVPGELRDALARDPALRAAWDALTPGRQRGYLVHLAGAKRPATRVARLARHRDRILAGKGMHDR